MINVNNKDIDIAFNRKAKLQSLVVGEDLDHTGYIINQNGDIVFTTKLSFETQLPPDAESYLDAYLTVQTTRQNIYEVLAND